MHGALPCLFLAELPVPTPAQMLVFAMPIFVVAGIGCLISRTDRIVHTVFPYLEWEQSLGWLNIKAERRANFGMRVLRILVYIMLFDSLFGIVWGAKGLQHLDNWSDPWVMGELALRVPALCFCLGIWVVYLGTYVFPRIRAEREAVEWKKIQAQMKADEEAKRARHPHLYSRVESPLQKPRKNTPLETAKKAAPTYQQRARRSFGPGG